MNRLARVAIYLLLPLTWVSCNDPGLETIYLIPRGFTGVVVIIFDQHDGVPAETEAGKQVYRIPLNGVLRTQMKPTYRMKGREYFYVDIDGSRSRIPILLPAGWEDIGDTIDTIDKNRNDIYVFGEEMGATAKNKPDHRVFRTFIVSEAKNIEAVLRSRNRVIDNALSKSNPKAEETRRTDHTVIQIMEISLCSAFPPRFR